MKLNVKHTCTILQLIFAIGLVTAPLFLLFSWFVMPEMGYLPHYSQNGSHIGISMTSTQPLSLHSLNLMQRLLGFGLELIPTSLSMLLLYKLIQLFHYYKQGAWFSKPAIATLYTSGQLLLLQTVSSIISAGLLPLIITWHTGHWQLSIGLESYQCNQIFMAIVIFVIVHIFKEGARLQDDADLTI